VALLSFGTLPKILNRGNTWGHPAGLTGPSFRDPLGKSRKPDAGQGVATQLSLHGAQAPRGLINKADGSSIAPSFSSTISLPFLLPRLILSKFSVPKVHLQTSKSCVSLHLPAAFPLDSNNQHAFRNTLRSFSHHLCQWPPVSASIWKRQHSLENLRAVWQCT
jgi:hypothetical protein